MGAFVTGSTGLLGNNLVRTLLKAGHEVGRFGQLGDTSARSSSAIWPTSPDSRMRSKASTPSSARLPVFANTMLPAIIRASSKMVDTSSSGIVGLELDGSPGNEQTPPSPLTQTNLHFMSKRKVEPLLHRFSREKGFFIASVLPAWMWRAVRRRSGRKRPNNA
jgi:dihydroflavonol-4-reductase